MAIPSILMDFLYHKNWYNIWDVSGDAGKLWLQLINICLKKGSYLFKKDLLKERFECNLKERPNTLFNAIINSLFIHEIRRLVNLFSMSTFYAPFPIFFRPPFPCFTLRLELLNKKKVWIISKTSIMWLGTAAMRAWKTVFEKRENIFKYSNYVFYSG